MYEGGKAVKDGHEYVRPKGNRSHENESGENSSQHSHNEGGDGGENSSQHPRSEGGDGGENSSQHPHSEGGDGSENHQEKTTEIIIQRAMQMLLTTQSTLQPEVLWQNMWLWESRIPSDCIP